MLNVFGSKPKDAVYVPDNAYAIRNDCKFGRWTDGNGEKGLGKEAQMVIVGFENFYGNLGKTKLENWGQVWAVCIEGCIPQNIVFCTYVKRESLQNLNKLVNKVISENDNFDPGNGIFTPTFSYREGQWGPYWALTWEWERLEEDAPIIERIKASLKDKYHLLEDPIGTKDMISLKGMKDKAERDKARRTFDEQYKEQLIKEEQKRKLLAGN